jgi:leucyl-tRNA synthetase
VPHFAEELWEALGHPAGSLSTAPWPVYQEEALTAERRTVVVQVNGKLRGRFHIHADADDQTIRETALAEENVRRFIADQPVRKVILVEKKLVNIVI